MHVDWTLFGLTLVILFLSSSLYALLLQTRLGRLLATRRTWVSVVIGVTLVIGALMPFLWGEALAMICAAFAVAGIPMIFRSFYNELRDEERAREEAWRE